MGAPGGHRPLTTGRLLRRAALLRCPVCGGRGVVRRWVGLAERCPRCGFRFERTSGHSIGYIGLNTIASFSVLFVVLVVGSFATYPDVQVGPVLLAAVLVALGFPLLFLPFSRTIWTAIDLAMTPLEVGEVAPGWELEQYDDPDRDPGADPGADRG